MFSGLWDNRQALPTLYSAKSSNDKDHKSNQSHRKHIFIKNTRHHLSCDHSLYIKASSCNNFLGLSVWKLIIENTNNYIRHGNDKMARSTTKLNSFIAFSVQVVNTKIIRSEYPHYIYMCKKSIRLLRNKFSFLMYRIKCPLLKSQYSACFAVRFYIL